LKPERARGYDFGVEQFFWKDRYRVEVSYFENRFRDQIAFVGDAATFGGPIKLADGRLTHFVNNDRTISRGMEFAVSMSPYKRRLLIGGTYTLLKTKLEAAADVIDFSSGKLVPNREVGFSLLRRPRHSGTLNIAWMGDKWEANLDGFFVGSRRDIDPATFARFQANGQPSFRQCLSAVGFGWNVSLHFARGNVCANRKPAQSGLSGSVGLSGLQTEFFCRNEVQNWRREVRKSGEV
jgi:outer membrane receptor protein involved in Fe transport